MQENFNINHFEIVRRDWRKVMVVGLLVVLIGLIITLLQPFLYKSSVSIYIMQKSSFSIDAYSASKSEERIANKLAQVIQTSSFLDKVLYSGFDINKDYFPKDEYKRREKWSETVEMVIVGEASKLIINVYHSDPSEALNITNAIAYILTEQKREYIGIEDIDLKVLDSPLVSKYPVKPNVVINLIISFLVGLAVGVAFVILTFDPARERLYANLVNKKEPHLIDYEDVPADESVEEDIYEAEDIPIIQDLDEVEELEEIEEAEDKAEEDEIEELSEVALPDVSAQVEEDEEEADLEIVSKPQAEDYAQEKRSFSPPTIPKAESKNENLAKFDKEDQFVGMPDL